MQLGGGRGGRQLVNTKLERKIWYLCGVWCTQDVLTSYNFQEGLSDGFPNARLFLGLENVKVTIALFLP